jgi:uncharacterized delta-60 repeat protein
MVIGVAAVSLALGGVVFALNSDGETPSFIAGRLDTSFSHDGIARIPDVADMYPSHASVAVDRNGMVVVTRYDSGSHETVVLRYDASGELDRTWTPYRVVRRYGGVSAIAVSGRGILIATWGGGRSADGGGGVLLRLGGNGALDTTFGTGGVADHVGHCSRCGFTDLAVAPSGAIFATMSPAPIPEGYVGELIQIAPNGRSWRGFDCIPKTQRTCGQTEALATTGRFIYVAGAGHTDDHRGPVIARYTMDGSLDAGFGDAGLAWIDAISALDVAVSPETGAVTVIGRRCPPHSEFCVSYVSGFTASGDPTPGFAGTVTFGEDDPEASEAIAVQVQDGLITILGTLHSCGPDGRPCFALERLTPAGAFDTTFGGAGYVHTEEAPADPSSMAVAGSTIVVTGGSYLARYQG